MAMHVAFRSDASLTIGAGHVMRCLTLASALRERHGAAVSFVCRDQRGHLCDLIETYGFPVRRLPASRTGAETGATPDPTTTSAFLWQEDASLSLAAFGSSSRKLDWLIVDHYGLDRQWERALRPRADRLMVIDDLADRTHDCDLLLDQNMIAAMHNRYVSKVPDGCMVLIGPRYALLQAAYGELHDCIPPRVGPIRRILIFMSGGDRDNLTLRALSAFLSLDRADVGADVVITADSPHADLIRRHIAGHANVHLHCGLPTLAPLMAEADLAIGAAGATSWERLCLGLPALVVTMAEHQRPVADELQRQGLVRWLGHQDQVGEALLRQAMGDMLRQGLDGEWSRRCSAVIDGRGVYRVCDALTAPADRSN